MKQIVMEVDGLLRGTYTARKDLVEGRMVLSARHMAVASLALGAFYGACMGVFGVVGGREQASLQLLATTLKVPLLFLLTLAVTFPSLYVFSALANGRLALVETLRLLVASIAVVCAVLASLGPITVFFTLSTTSYPFLKLLNVGFMGVAGIAGLLFLRRAVLSPVGGATSPAEGEEGERGARRVFAAWMVLYGFVGAQMGWILRPFLGAPGEPFQWFRERQGNIFEGIMETLRRLMD